MSCYDKLPSDVWWLSLLTLPKCRHKQFTGSHQLERMSAWHVIHLQQVCCCYVHCRYNMNPQVFHELVQAIRTSPFSLFSHSSPIPLWLINLFSFLWFTYNAHWAPWYFILSSVIFRWYVYSYSNFQLNCRYLYISADEHYYLVKAVYMPNYKDFSHTVSQTIGVNHYHNEYTNITYWIFLFSISHTYCFEL